MELETAKEVLGPELSLVAAFLGTVVAVVLALFKKGTLFGSEVKVVAPRNREVEELKRMADTMEKLEAHVQEGIIILRERRRR